MSLHLNSILEKSKILNKSSPIFKRMVTELYEKNFKETLRLFFTEDEEENFMEVLAMFTTNLYCIPKSTPKNKRLKSLMNQIMSKYIVSKYNIFLKTHEIKVFFKGKFYNIRIFELQ